MYDQSQLQFSSARCWQCGGQFLVGRNAFQGLCESCQRPHGLAVAPRDGQLQPSPPQRRSRIPPIIWLLLPVVAVLGVVSLLLCILLPQVQTSWLDGPDKKAGGRPGSGPGSGGIVQPGEHLQWGGAEGALTAVKLDDDGVEDFVGVYRLLDEQANATMYLGAFDGKTLTRRWHSSALGTLSDNGSHIRSAAAGRRVVVTDSRMVAHVFELAAGRQVGSVKLTDHARRMCGEPGGDRVWVDVADGNGVVIDLKVAQGRAAPTAMFCSSKEVPVCKAAPAPCEDDDPALQVAGFLGTRYFHDGSAGVALGIKMPGTSLPMLAGFDVATKKVKWAAPVASERQSPSTFEPAIQLEGARVYVVYQLKDSGGLQIAALETATGRRIWDSPLSHLAKGAMATEIVATPTRVYVPHWTWLEVFDASNGALVGTVGIW